MIISKTQYETAPDDSYSIISLKINDDCLAIKFSASGCEGNSWAPQLIDAGGVAESLPPQRTLRLSLDNNELCLAIVIKEISFNIKGLQVKGTSKVGCISKCRKGCQPSTSSFQFENSISKVGNLKSSATF